MPPNRAVLTVDLGALGRNAETLRTRAGGAELTAVVKADAYGLGAAEVARHVAENCGITTFFLASARQADKVRHAVNKPGIGLVQVYILNGYSAADAHRYDLLSLRPVLNSHAEVAAWAQRGGPCALGVDIGMNRLGMAPEELSNICTTTGLDRDDVRMILMHLSHAGEPDASENEDQAQLFEEVQSWNRKAFPKAKFSLSASGGLHLSASFREGLVRPGIALYGASPDGDAASALETVATLTAPVLLTRRIAVGDSVGYGGRWTAERPTRLAVLALGYADGYHRTLSNKGVVAIHGKECPVVGTISMDLTVIDVTDVGEVVPGDRAEIFGPQIAIDRLASLAGTISYELLTSVGDRVERRYVW